jgi:pyridoxal biosynthesis lyase PdxS
MVMGKHAMIAKKRMPNKIRIELVVSFIVHLQVVQEVDDALTAKVPAPVRNGTGELYRLETIQKNSEAFQLRNSDFIFSRTTCGRVNYPCG